MSTHVFPEDLRAWVLGEADGVVSMSVEQHVLRCARCQGAVAAALAATPAADDRPELRQAVPDLDLSLIHI